MIYGLSGIQSLGGRPAAVKAYAPEATEESSIGFMLSESCLVARGALTRRKEIKKEVPKTRKAAEVGEVCRV